MVEGSGPGAASGRQYSLRSDNHSLIVYSDLQDQAFVNQSKDFERLTLYEQRINRALEKNRRQLDQLQAERKRQRQEALDQACLLSQVPVTPALQNEEQPASEEHSGGARLEHDTDPPATVVENGFVFSSEEIKRTIDRRSHLIHAGMMQTRADALIKARVNRPVNRGSGGD